jgi:hypothetical protein
MAPTETAPNSLRPVTFFANRSRGRPTPIAVENHQMRASALAGVLLSLWISTATPSLAQSLSDQLIPAADRAHDFGTVARAAKTEHRFEIKNPFSKPLHLRSISASCGCTTPIIETEWIQPGETGSVLARFNTGTFTGDRKATLNLTIDSPNHLQLQLNVRGYIRSDIVINPGELNFGTVPVGESKQVEAVIEYAGRNDWKLTGISGSELVSGTLTETARSTGRVTYKLSAVLAPAAEPGPQATELILHTNDARLKSVPLSCLAQIEASLSVSPNNVSLGEMKPGQAIEKRLLVKGAVPFQILDVRVPNMEVHFEPSEEPKAIQFLNLVLIPEDDARAGDVRAKLAITTDMEGEKEVTVDLSYKIRPADPRSESQAAELSNKVSSRARKSAIQ